MQNVPTSNTQQWSSFKHFGWLVFFTGKGGNGPMDRSTLPLNHEHSCPRLFYIVSICPFFSPRSSLNWCSYYVPLGNTYSFSTSFSFPPKPNLQWYDFSHIHIHSARIVTVSSLSHHRSLISLVAGADLCSLNHSNGCPIFRLMATSWCALFYLSLVSVQRLPFTFMPLFCDIFFPRFS